MADTRSDVVVTAKTWTNLYSASGITVGVAVDVFNKGSGNCIVAIKATQPADGVGVPLFAGPEGNHMTVAASQSGLWCYSDNGTRLLVQE